MQRYLDEATLTLTLALPLTHLDEGTLLELPHRLGLVAAAVHAAALVRVELLAWLGSRFSGQGQGLSSGSGQGLGY